MPGRKSEVLLEKEGAATGAMTATVTMHQNTCRSTSAMLRVDEQEGSRAWCREREEGRREEV